jgi:GDP-mannose 6-dehydrogenase
MNITVVGLGYVGAVSAACLASAGHHVWGVDIDGDKVRAINDGRSPIVEQGLEEKIAEARASGSLRATCDISEALVNSDLCFVAVATPSRSNGAIDSTHLFRACEQIGQALKRLGRSQVVVVRSSVLPSIFDECAGRLRTISGDTVILCTNPEFLREGTAIADFFHPPFTLLGIDDTAAETTLRAVYHHIPAPVHVLPPKEALMVKYASNAFHALKIAFANEIGALCGEAAIDAHDVMSVFCKDTKLNISDKYLQPGFAFGGSCLPKDVRAMVYAAKHHDLDLPLIGALMPSNDSVVRRTLSQICTMGVRKIGLIGLGFKINTDDLRESPLVDLAERLLGKGYMLKIYDPNVSITQLRGANRSYIEKTIPHLSRLLVQTADDLSGCELLVVGHEYPSVEELLHEATIPTLVLTPTASHCGESLERAKRCADSEPAELVTPSGTGQSNITLVHA